MTDKIAVASYHRLVDEIAGLYGGARRAVVEAYWRIGQRIVEVEQEGAIKAAHGSGLLQKLSTDLTQKYGSGFSERSLERMRAFYLSHPKSSPATKLTWAHHVELLSISDKKKRLELEKQVERDELDRNSLRTLVRNELVREEVSLNLSAPDKIQEPPELLIPRRGKPYTYRIIKPKLVGAGASELLIDLGFSCTKDLDNITGKNFVPDTLVSSFKTAEGFKLSVARCALRDLYTYLAEVERVVDGDTLRVIVDLGFGFKTRQYLRLRGIDCPETGTPEGTKASDLVRSKIRVASRIVLCSSKSDKYDRYLADIYFTDAQGQEVYLNNLLLQEGLAVRMDN